MKSRLRKADIAALLLAAATWAGAQEIYLCNGVYTDVAAKGCKSIQPEKRPETDGQRQTNQPKTSPKQTAPTPTATAETASRTVSVRSLEAKDGDTIVVYFQGKREQVRLTGIDCPEIKQEWGFKALDFTRAKTWGKDVRLEFDAQQRDRYGRLLAYVWLNDTTMLNEELVRQGLAMIATYPPNVTYVQRFKDAQQEAFREKKGFWQQGGLKQNPYNYRKERRRQTMDFSVEP